MPGSGPFSILGRILLLTGVALAVVGLLLMLGSRIPFLGRLPGDIVWTRGSTRIYLPITTSLLISLVLSVVLSLLSGLRR